MNLDQFLNKISIDRKNILIVIVSTWFVHLLDIFDLLILDIFDLILGDRFFGIAFFPFFVYKFLDWAAIILLLCAWKIIWEKHFEFTTIRWYYRLAIVVEIGFFALFLIISLLAFFGNADSYHSLNSFGVSLQKIQGKLFCILQIVAFAQLAGIKSDLYGLKNWFISTSIAISVISLFFGYGWFLSAVALGIKVILLQKIYHSLARTDSPAPCLS